MPLRHHQLSAAILAGGKSSRMGKNKALLPVGKHTMIERIVMVVRSITRDIALITNSPEEYRFLNLPTYADEIVGIGPLGGIYTALKRGAGERCLIVACDLPFVSEELLATLHELAIACEIAGFQSERGIEPLCAIYSKSCLPIIQLQIAQHDYRVHRLFSSTRSKILPITATTKKSHAPALFNVNTPQEFEQASRYANDAC